MGKQSARIYFQGKDHKEIYYQGHYHKAMYIGSQLVWEKLIDERLDIVSSISYNGNCYVVRQFKYSDSDAELRILVGTALDELVLFDTIMVGFFL